MERPLMDEGETDFWQERQAVTEEYPCAREGTFLNVFTVQTLFPYLFIYYFSYYLH